MLNEGEEIRGSKRKVIWVESEKTQDSVREAKSTEYQEDEERTFVPSAVSVPLKPLFRCDNQCSEKTLSSWQLASVVLDEGDEACTTNLCQKCFNEHLQAKGETSLSNVQWRQVVQKKAYRGRKWKMRKDRICVECGSICLMNDRRRRSFDSWLTKKSRQKYKVSGSRNRQPKNTWNK